MRETVQGGSALVLGLYPSGLKTKMGFRLYRRVHFPGGSINLSTAGASLSFGVRGAHVTLGRHGITQTVGIPGSGIFWTHQNGYQHTGVHSGLGRDGWAVRNYHLALLVLLAMLLWGWLKS